MWLKLTYFVIMMDNQVIHSYNGGLDPSYQQINQTLQTMLASLQATQVTMQALQASQQVIQLDLANLKKYSHNGSATQAVSTIVPLLNNQGAFPMNFPDTRGGLSACSNAQFNQLLTFYGLQYAGGNAHADLAAKRSLLFSHLGVRE